VPIRCDLYVLLNRDMEIIYGTFKEHDANGSQSLDLGELAQVFQQTMRHNHNINVETVDGITAGFTANEVGVIGKITQDAFVMIMARYIKRSPRCLHDYSNYWPRCDPGQSNNNAGPAAPNSGSTARRSGRTR